jgi:hypothetical protein
LQDNETKSPKTHDKFDSVRIRRRRPFMLTMHPTLLIGPADWDATRMPQHEFLARMAKL